MDESKVGEDTANCKEGVNNCKKGNSNSKVRHDSQSKNIYVHSIYQLHSAQWMLKYFIKKVLKG